jgi:hypothetical protein
MRECVAHGEANCVVLGTTLHPHIPTQRCLVVDEVDTRVKTFANFKLPMHS